MPAQGNITAKYGRPLSLFPSPQADELYRCVARRFKFSAQLSRTAFAAIFEIVAGPQDVFQRGR